MQGTSARAEADHVAAAPARGRSKSFPANFANSDSGVYYRTCWGAPDSIANRVSSTLSKPLPSGFLARNRPNERSKCWKALGRFEVSRINK